MAFKTLTIIVLGVSSTFAASVGKQSTLTDCLKKDGVTFDVAGSAAWENDIAPFNNRVHFTPAVVVAPTSIPQIQRAVQCAAKADLKATAKCGGHSYASFGLGGEDGHMVIDLKNMYNVILNKDTNIATIQPGARLGHVATELYKQGKRGFSHGTCPGVGVSGHSLHGGYGMSSHRYGLATDWIVEMSIVLPDGSLVKASKTSNADLFWGLRGAGSNFWIVASYDFNTFSVDNVKVTYFDIPFHWNESTAVGNLGILEEYTKTMPAELTMRAFVSSSQQFFEGMYFGGVADLRKALQPLLAKTGMSIGNAVNGTWMDLFAHYANALTDPYGPYSAHETFYAKILMLKGLNGQSLENFVEYWAHNTSTNARSWWFQLDLHGGENSGVTNGDHSASSYPHRDKLYLIQFYDRSFGSYPSKGFAFLDDWVAHTVQPLSTSDYGMYINYADPSLSRVDAERQYYGNHLGRLQELKAKHDPDERFFYPQSVEPATGA